MTSDMNGLAVTPYGTLYFPSENKYSVRSMQVPISGNLGTTCGNCYLPSSAGSLCCQTCDQVKAAHAALQLMYTSLLCFAQCNPTGCPATCSASPCATTASPTGQLCLDPFICPFLRYLISCTTVSFSSCCHLSLISVLCSSHGSCAHDQCLRSQPLASQSVDLDVNQ